MQEIFQQYRNLGSIPGNSAFSIAQRQPFQVRIIQIPYFNFIQPNTIEINQQSHQQNKIKNSQPMRCQFKEIQMKGQAPLAITTQNVKNPNSHAIQGLSTSTDQQLSQNEEPSPQIISERDQSNHIFQHQQHEKEFLKIKVGNDYIDSTEEIKNNENQCNYDQKLQDLDKILKASSKAHGQKVPQLKLKSIVRANKCNREKRIRSDVLYKTIIRDMRKFYTQDFNRVTNYSQKKRYKQPQLYLHRSLIKYVESQFLELSQDITGSSKINFETQNFDDLIYFLGALMYPKLLFNNQGLSLKNQRQKLKEQTLHHYLYQFCAFKLRHLTKLKYFAFFYSHYYNQQILTNKRIENKAKMAQHFEQYTEATGVIMKLCQQTLNSLVDSFSNHGMNQMLAERLKGFRSIQLKSILPQENDFIHIEEQIPQIEKSQENNVQVEEVKEQIKKRKVRQIFMVEKIKKSEIQAIGQEINTDCEIY